MNISVDVGYGYTKAVSDTGARMSFPSATAPAAVDYLTDGVFRRRFDYTVRITDLSGTVDRQVGVIVNGSVAKLMPNRARRSGFGGDSGNDGQKISRAQDLLYVRPRQARTRRPSFKAGKQSNRLQSASERKLAEECRLNMAFMWFLGFA